MQEPLAPQLNVEIICIEPTKTNAALADRFRQLVDEAGEVNTATFPELYRNALVLSFARLNQEIVGVGAIKRPYENHRDTVFAKAKATIPSSGFTYELGWFHVLKEFGGNHIASRMVEKLMPWVQGASVYATSRNNNIAMHKALEKRGGFITEGSDYPSLQGTVPLKLFIRPS